jgi:hypothetical protein
LVLTVKLENLHDSLAEAALGLLGRAFDKDNDFVLLVYKLPANVSPC